MRHRKAQGVVALLAVAGGVFAAAGSASQRDATDITPVPSANTKAPGYAPPNVLPPEWRQTPVAQGSNKLENGTAAIPYYGYDGDGPMVPPAVSRAEAAKTEPDKNPDLVLGGLHYLFQGHEHAGPAASGYITRIDLDGDGAH